MAKLGLGLKVSSESPANVENIEPVGEYSLHFNGVDNYVSLPEFNLGTQNTINIWVKWSGTGQMQHIPTSANAWDGGSYHFYPTGPPSPGMYVRIGDEAQQWNAGDIPTHMTNAALGDWQMWSITRNGDDVELWINAESQGTKTFSTPGDTLFDTIGSGWLSPGSAIPYLVWNGFISDVSLWKTPLTQSNLDDMYNSGVPTDLSATTPIVLDGYWTFNDGSTANDMQVESLGNEEVPNGNFTGVADGTDPVGNIAGWAAYGATTTREVENESLKLVTTGGNIGIQWQETLTAGQAYKLTCTATGDLGAGGIYISAAGTQSIDTTTGEIEAYFIAGSGTDVIFFRAGANAAGTVYYDNISVKESNLEHGTIVGATHQIDVPPGYANAYSLFFNGTEQYVDSIGNCPSTDAFSISAWAMITGTPTSQYKCWYSAGPLAAPDIWLGIHDDSTPAVRVHCGGPAKDTYNNSFRRDIWNHVVFTWDGTDGIVYINGTEAVSDTGFNTPTAQTAEIGLNADDHSQNRWVGGIDEISIWSKVLSLAEVEAMYNFGHPLSIDQTATLTSYWTFNDGTTADDDSGNGNHGALSSTPPVHSVNTP